MKIEVAFPVRGTVLDSDHLYPLYSALSHIVPQFHRPESGFRFGPITGERGDRGILRLNDRSCLRARVPADQIALVLPLAGRALEIGGRAITLGVPTVSALKPAAVLAARVVIYKNATEPSRFLDVTRRKLDEVKIDGEPGILLVRGGERAGEPRRQVLRIKGKRVVGYALQVAGLTAEESIRLQEESVSGRSLMGCGFFVPYRPRLS
jgi:CRISPR-associated endonuclease/helicase Cas3